MTDAALELFAQRGYDGTTVDAVAERAGVARRTFFRHFATKDDAVLPDHEALLGRVQAVLDGWDGDPLDALLPAAHVVLDAYLAEREVAVARYGVLARVPELRERERAVVTRYERAFASFLRARLPRGTEGPPAGAPAGAASPADVLPDVLAAALVAAHNGVLRQWLRDPAGVDAAARLDEALGWVVRSLTEGPVAPRRAAGADVGAAQTLRRIRALADEALRGEGSEPV
ncbi:TetR family transcriptional regulator [Thalassiella azotivora]